MSIINSRYTYNVNVLPIKKRNKLYSKLIISTAAFRHLCNSSTALLLWIPISTSLVIHRAELVDRCDNNRLVVGNSIPYAYFDYCTSLGIQNSISETNSGGFQDQPVPLHGSCGAVARLVHCIAGGAA